MFLLRIIAATTRKMLAISVSARISDSIRAAIQALSEVHNSWLQPKVMPTSVRSHITFFGFIDGDAVRAKVLR
jgi:hypothetical protein